MNELTLTKLQKQLRKELPKSISSQIKEGQYIVVNLKQPLYIYFKDNYLQFTDDTETWSRLIAKLNQLKSNIKNDIVNTAYVKMTLLILPMTTSKTRSLNLI